MTIRRDGMTRRQCLAATAAGVLAAGLRPRPASALEPIRQGYQTNIWGMPTYYLLQSGALEKRGIKFQEFAVASGNREFFKLAAFDHETSIRMREVQANGAGEALNRLEATGTQVARVTRARAEPGKFNAAVVPGITEFTFDYFVKTAGLTLQKVPYRDIVQAATDLGEGRLQVYMSSYAILLPQTEALRIRPLVVNGRERAPMLPNVPTAREAGFPKSASP